MPTTAKIDANTARELVKKTSAQATVTRAAVTRTDPITGQTTIFAPRRGERPDQFEGSDVIVPDTSIGCPFCQGAESLTPAPVWIGRRRVNELATAAMPKSASLQHQASLARQTALAHIECIDDPEELGRDEFADWLVRVVPNKFPAITCIQKGDSLNDKGSASRRSKLFAEAPVRGGHDVIIESPEHHESLTELGTSRIAIILAAFRDRIGHWQGTDGIAYISAFKNCGGEAGASLAHSHSQIIATDIVPSHVRESINRTAKYRAESGCCLQCDLVRAEVKEKTRVIAKTDELVAFCPFASAMPMAVRITSFQHADRFDEFDDARIESVARMLKRVTSWIERLMPGKAYNFVLHTRPPAAKNAADSFHWTLDIFPRISHIAGFEFGSQCMINSVMPEDAAAKYQRCAAKEDPRGVR